MNDGVLITELPTELQFSIYSLLTSKDLLAFSKINKKTQQNILYYFNDLIKEINDLPEFKNPDNLIHFLSNRIKQSIDKFGLSLKFQGHYSLMLSPESINKENEFSVCVLDNLLKSDGFDLLDDKTKLAGFDQLNKFLNNINYEVLSKDLNSESSNFFCSPSVTGIPPKFLADHKETLATLKTVYFMNSQIPPEDLDAFIACLRDCSELWLYQAGITEFPKALLNLKNLIHLNLSKNQLTSIPEEISQLKKLDHLNLSHNKIERLPKAVENIPFKKLILDDNPIKALTRGVFKTLKTKHQNPESLIADHRFPFPKAKLFLFTGLLYALLRHLSIAQSNNHLLNVLCSSAILLPAAWGLLSVAESLVFKTFLSTMMDRVSNTRSTPLSEASAIAYTEGYEASRKNHLLNYLGHFISEKPDDFLQGYYDGMNNQPVIIRKRERGASAQNNELHLSSKKQRLG